tara:strand:- start:2 stop:298 length:297 start_codon:yes stop_codon:yes gene_type:complete
MTKKALIQGSRICQLADKVFEVADGLTWVDVADDTVVDLDTYVDGKVVKYVEPTLTYAQKRAAEYPSYADQFDKIYHDGIDEWKKVIKAVKDKHPKPE